MKFAKRYLAVLLIVGGVGTSASAMAQQQGDNDNQRTRQAQAVSRAVYETIESAQALVDSDDLPGALVILTEASRNRKLTDYERANVLGYLGSTHFGLGQYTAAMAAFESVLLIDNLEAALRRRTLYTLAQINAVSENHENALAYIDIWFSLEANPGSDAFMLRAQTLYHLDRYRDMIPEIETAIEIAGTTGIPVKENWLILLNFAYFQLEDFRKVRDIQIELLESWPKKSYWLTLASAYAELGEERYSLASYDIAYRLGYLDQEAQLLTLARLYVQQGIPYFAGTLLERSFSAGTIVENETSLRLLAQAWAQSNEDKRVIAALVRAAAYDTGGEIDQLLANAYLAADRYAECVDAARAAIAKGGMKKVEYAHISLGMCLYNLHEFDAAGAAFARAGASSQLEKLANQWLKVIDFDRSRIAQISLAEAAATRQAEELRHRRRGSEQI